MVDGSASPPSDWTERYRPQSENQLLGNIPQRQRIRKWLKEWNLNSTSKRALLLIGPPGVGKTSIARAISNDQGWDVIELNASDSRNAASIRKAATHGSRHKTLFSQGAGNSTPRTLILLDEVDHIQGGLVKVSEEIIVESITNNNTKKSVMQKGDRGGKAELMQLLEKTKQPVILACNDEMRLWGRSSNWKEVRDRFAKFCIIVRFKRVDNEGLRAVASSVMEKENLTIDPRAMDLLIRSNSGDLRALIRDIESMATISGGHLNNTIVKDQIELGPRDSHLEIFPGLEKMYLANSAKEVNNHSRLLDKDPDELIAWISWNNSLIFKSKKAIEKGSKSLSIADGFLPVRFTNRAYRSWYWASNLASISTICSEELPKGKVYSSYPHFLKRGFESWRRSRIITKLSRASGCSNKAARDEFYAPLAALHDYTKPGNDVNDFKISMNYDFDAEEYVLLCGLPLNRKNTKKIINQYSKMSDTESIQESELELEHHEIQDDVDKGSQMRLF